MAKHVTVFKMQVKPGMVDDVLKLMNEEGAQERRLAANGWESTIVGKSKSDPDEVWVTVAWDNTENYNKNSSSPEQNAWYEKMRGLLASDPEWHDCDVIEEQHA